ncbi:hypothetical protein KQX54_003236 [Cotesia glomerata]|uniref:Uncharacterized protein n=1 Tax=Cotesia glomerata TaxID=32391 RepID=A0AAV7J1Q9_COTGL|nr:hypothetical protein KQX54_003236 [Cotesia glomerata]
MWPAYSNLAFGIYAILRCSIQTRCSIRRGDSQHPTSNTQTQHLSQKPSTINHHNDSNSQVIEMGLSLSLNSPLSPSCSLIHGWTSSRWLGLALYSSTHHVIRYTASAQYLSTLHGPVGTFFLDYSPPASAGRHAGCERIVVYLALPASPRL